MSNINFTIDQTDLKVLFLHTQDAYPGYTFERWTKEVEQSYIEYHKRNSENTEKYGAPKTFSQWINGQIIALT